MADDSSRRGNAYFNPDILDWAARTHAPHDGGLEAAFMTPLRAAVPAIQVGPSEGRLLALLLRLAGARRVVELGTLVGYSAIHIARALPADGKLWTIEHDARHAALARQNLAEAGLSERVEVLEMDGPAGLAHLERAGPFCAVFLDADKERYDLYGRWAARHVRPGGLLLGDNAFLFGELLDDGPRPEAMRRFHEEARAAFDTVCIPTPDGLLLGVKRS